MSLAHAPWVAFQSTIPHVERDQEKPVDPPWEKFGFSKLTPARIFVPLRDGRIFKTPADVTQN